MHGTFKAARLPILAIQTWWDLVLVPLTSPLLWASSGVPMWMPRRHRAVGRGRPTLACSFVSHGPEQATLENRELTAQMLQVNRRKQR